MNPRSRLLLTTLILASLAVLAGWCLLAVGYDSAGSLSDSQSNELGFNKPLTAELIQGLLAAALRPSALPRWWSIAGWPLVCSVMHCWALVILWTNRQPKPWHRVWFAVQNAYFFPGFLGLLAWPMMLLSTQPWDGETISDIDPTMIATTPWLLVTWVYLYLTWPPSSKASDISNLNTAATPL